MIWEKLWDYFSYTSTTLINQYVNSVSLIKCKTYDIIYCFILGGEEWTNNLEIYSSKFEVKYSLCHLLKAFYIYKKV